ncbi:MAG: pentapeptide repeat-containing protein [Gemmatimonas sp.]
MPSEVSPPTLGCCTVCGYSAGERLKTALSGGTLYCELHYPLFGESLKASWTNKTVRRLGDLLQRALRGETTTPLSFRGIQWAWPLRCDGITIRDLDFSDSTFTDLVEFTNCLFGGTLDLTRCRFHRYVNFQNSKFVGGLSAAASEIGGDVSLQGCTFNDDVHFSEIKVAGMFSTTNATFHRFASFRGATVSEYGFFNQTCFNGYVSFENAVLNRYSSFGTSSFSSVTNFNSCLFKSDTTFEDAFFNLTPTFHDAIFQRDVSFQGVTFNKLNARGDDHNLRALRLIAESRQSKEEERQFYSLEQKSVTRQEPLSISSAFAWLYEISSSYGTSLDRALAVFVSTNMAMTLLYWALGDGRFLEACQITLSQIFDPFGIWRENSVVASWSALGEKILRSLHSLLDFVLLVIAVIAIRWRYKKE